MPIPRLYVPQPLVHGATLALDSQGARHVRQVLRLASGAALRVFDGSGAEHEARLLTLGRSQVMVEIGARTSAIPEPDLSLTLAQGIPRGERMDLILQKAVELGVSRIQPLWMQRSQGRMKGERLASRMQHWRGVMSSACEQCGRGTLPTLEAPAAFPAWVESAPADVLQLLLDPHDGQPLQALRPSGNCIVLLVGPEGGISPEEQGLACQAGFAAVRLGPRILRTETAALAALACLQLLWGDLG
jgi:16S rRNA (uracil1498-N3)-methyltransferase